MADIFVSSTSVGANDGTTWADAFTTLGAAITAASADDRVVVDSNHTETVADIAYNLLDRVTILSSTKTGATTVTYQKAASAQVTSTGANDDIDFNAPSAGYMFGMYIKAGRDIFMNDMCTEDNTLEVGNGAGTLSNFTCSNSSGWISKNDTRHNLSINANVPLIACANRTFINLIGGTVSSDRVTANNGHSVFQCSSTSSLQADGVDCSGFQQANLLDWNFGNNGVAKLTRMRINSATTNLVKNPDVKVSGDIVIDAVDDANTVNRKFRNYYEGTVESDTGIKLTDSNFSFSNKYTTTTRVIPFFVALEDLLGVGFADFSSPRTFEIEIAQDGTTTPLDTDELSVRVMFPDDTTASYILEDTKPADNQSGTQIPSSTESWDGLSGTNVRQKITLTTSATGKEGSFQIYASLMKQNTTAYITLKSVT